jgi:pimeloyl-ACP methyl ester carboxylesterase
VTDSDRAVFLVHGFGSSVRSSWERYGWIDAFEQRGRRVLAPDLPGHGLAEKPTDPEDYGMIEDEVYAHAKPLGPVDAVGFSLGARLLLSIEAEHPGTFSRLVIGGIGSNVFNFRSPELLASAIEHRDSDRAPNSPMAEAFVVGAYRSSNNPEALAAFLRRPLRQRIGVEELDGVTCPVLVVVGESDTMVHPVTKLTEHLSDVRVVTVPLADHLDTMRSPLFLEASLEFLSAPSN